MLEPKPTKIVLARVGSVWLEAEVAPNWLALTMNSAHEIVGTPRRSIAMLLQFDDIETFVKNVTTVVQEVWKR